MGVTGFLVMKRKGMVQGANWHGKVATILLYAMMMLHVFWYDIPSVLSNLSIIVCTGMISLSFVLYGFRNITALKQV